MADCYYHGYSGGPGACSECEEERRKNLKKGTLPGDNVAAESVIKGPRFHPDDTVRSK